MPTSSPPNSKTCGIFSSCITRQTTRAWRSSPIFKPGDAEADLAATILGGGRSSRLYKKLVYEKQIAQDVGVNQQSLILGSVFEVQATAKAGVKPEDLEKAINAELDAFRKDGPTAAELTR